MHFATLTSAALLRSSFVRPFATHACHDASSRTLTSTNVDILNPLSFFVFNTSILAMGRPVSPAGDRLSSDSFDLFGSIHHLRYGSNQVDRQRKHDSRIVLGADFHQGLQITQLDRRGCCWMTLAAIDNFSA